MLNCLLSVVPQTYLNMLGAFYGVTAAPRVWWLDVAATLKQHGWKQSRCDRCIFGLFSPAPEGTSGRTTLGNIQIRVIGVYADDFLIGDPGRSVLMVVWTTRPEVYPPPQTHRRDARCCHSHRDVRGIPLPIANVRCDGGMKCEATVHTSSPFTLF